MQGDEFDTDFDYALPESLIAQKPLAMRSDSRLLHLTPEGACEDRVFRDLSQLVNPGDLLVFNNTRVIPSRLYGRKATGGRIELLLERITGSHEALVQIKASKSPAPDVTLKLDGDAEATVQGRDGPFFRVRFSAPAETIFARLGHMPLPPYIRREDALSDRERYQTVYASQPGAVAAPTAGLHFDRGQLNRLRSRGVQTAELTLHVGAGTFSPLRSEQWASGELHAERVEVSEALCSRIKSVRESEGRVVAIGTTVARALESAAQSGTLRPLHGETRLFIRPGFEFQCIDAMLTNFHLPRSSLLMLVAAFSGQDSVMRAYAHAVAGGYRFYSYGDAMFCHRGGQHAV